MISDELVFLKEALNNYTNEGISDDELNVLLKFYSDLVEKLDLLRPNFNLALFEANRELTRLKSYKHARSSY